MSLFNFGMLTKKNLSFSSFIAFFLFNMTENIKPETEKNHTLAIPMSLSCKLDVTEYCTREPQQIQIPIVRNPNKIRLYVHFEGKNPSCILLKMHDFFSVSIFSVASFSLKIYNLKFNTTILPQEAHYFLVNDIKNVTIALGLKDKLPFHAAPIADLIIRIPNKKKRTLLLPHHFLKSKSKNKKAVNTENASSNNDEQNKNNGESNNEQKVDTIDSAFDDTNINESKMNNENAEIENNTNHQNNDENYSDGQNINIDDNIAVNSNSENEDNAPYFTSVVTSIVIDACSLKAERNSSKSDLLVQKGDYFSRIGDPKSASLFYWSAGVRGITSLVKLAKLSRELSIIDRTRFQLLTHFPSEINKISSEKQKYPSSFNEAVDLLSDPKKLLLINDYHSKNEINFNAKLSATHPVSYLYSKQSRKNKNQVTKSYNNNYFLDKLRARECIKLISKTQPYIALKICLKYPEYTEFIPIPCRVEEVMDAFIQICVKQKYDNTMLFYFAELFAKNGLIARAMQIGYNISVLSTLPECAMRRACWVMLVTRQFSNLFMLLETYFKRCQNRSIGFLSANIVYNHLMTVKKVNYKYKNTQRCVQTIVDPLDPSDLDFLCIVLDAACFLFLSGYVDDFKDILSAISTQNRKYFEKTGIPPEFDFYVFIDKASTFAVNDRIAKESIFALGDEGTLNNAYNTLLNFEMVVPHPIPRIAIYDLRKGKKNLRKAAFWQQIRDCSMFHQILLVLGHYDILYTIPKLMQRDHTVMSFTDAVNKIIEIYLHAIEKIHRIMPLKQIFVHPLKFHNKFLDNQKVVFNNALKNALPHYVVMLSENDCNVFYDNSLIVPWRLTL